MLGEQVLVASIDCCTAANDAEKKAKLCQQ